MKPQNQSKRNAYDLNFVAQNLNKPSSKKIIIDRGNDPYNAGGRLKSISAESKERK